MTPYPELMGIWAVCITWSALFLTAVSIYLYVGSRKNRTQSDHAASNFGFLRDFVFVWVLLGLLALYIVSIDRSSSILFASGNIVVEALLIAYTVKNKPPKTDEGHCYGPELK